MKSIKIIILFFFSMLKPEKICCFPALLVHRQTVLQDTTKYLSENDGTKYVNSLLSSSIDPRCNSEALQRIMFTVCFLTPSGNITQIRKILILEHPRRCKGVQNEGS